MVEKEDVPAGMWLDQRSNPINKKQELERGPHSSLSIVLLLSSVIFVVLYGVAVTLAGWFCLISSFLFGVLFIAKMIGRVLS